MELQISGIDQVIRRLRNAPKLIVYASFVKAFDRSMGVLAAEIESHAIGLPRGMGDELAEAVMVYPSEIDANGKGGEAAVGFDKKKTPRTAVPHDAVALWLEYGHILVSGGKQVGAVPAYPFIRPAFDAGKDRAIQVFQEVLLETLATDVEIPEA